MILWPWFSRVVGWSQFSVKSLDAFAFGRVERKCSHVRTSTSSFGFNYCDRACTMRCFAWLTLDFTCYESYIRRAFDSADSTRRELLQHWALKPGAWRERKSAGPREGGGGEEKGEGEGEYDNGSFASRMSDTRRRLLGVLGMDDNTAEVQVCSCV